MVLDDLRIEDGKVAIEPAFEASAPVGDAEVEPDVRFDVAVDFVDLREEGHWILELHLFLIDPSGRFLDLFQLQRHAVDHLHGPIKQSKQPFQLAVSTDVDSSRYQSADNKFNRLGPDSETRTCNKKWRVKRLNWTNQMLSIRFSRSDEESRNKRTPIRVNFRRGRRGGGGGNGIVWRPK